MVVKMTIAEKLQRLRQGFTKVTRKLGIGRQSKSVTAGPLSILKGLAETDFFGGLVANGFLKVDDQLPTSRRPVAD